MATPKPRAFFVFKLASVALSLAFVFLSLEISLRILKPSWLELRMSILNPGTNMRRFGSDLAWPVERHDGRFVSFVANSRFRVTHYEYDHPVQIDPWGGRSVEYCLEAAEGTPTPFLGDSFLFGVGVPDDATYVNLLAAKWKRCLLNLGVPGTTLDQQIDIIELRHQALGRPRLYVFNVFLGNDIDLSDSQPQAATA